MKEPKSMVFDFDGTIAELKEFKENDYGNPIQKTISLMKITKKLGYIIVVFTARSWVEWNNLKNYLDYNQIPFDNLVCGKPIGLIYYDDRSVNSEKDFLDKLKDIENDSSSS